jgi:hypothetical protein
VFSFEAWKGGVVAPRWGLSLDFVPHVSGSSVKWHRTSKSAIYDLCVDARDKNFDLSPHRGAAAISDRVHAVVPGALSRAQDFWNRFGTVRDLPAAFIWLKEYLSTGGLGFDNYVQHGLALAFVLAINGRRTEGELELDRWIGRRRLNEAMERRLRELFRDTPNAAPSALAG